MTQPHSSPRSTSVDPKHISALWQKQRAYFGTRTTQSLAWRKDALERLLASIQKHESLLTQALFTDLGKPEFESYATEIGFVCAEIRHALSHLEDWASPKKVPTSMLLFKSTSRIQAEPKGLTLILAPWNYPVQLLLNPLVGALAAGNCAVLKPSELAPACSRALAQVISTAFDPSSVALFEGGSDVAEELLKLKWDHIFFTGGPTIGRKVAMAAAQNLTPTTLELGGKSPCVVDKTARLKLAARRIAWGKGLNAGQSCVAPDYLLVHEAVYSEFLEYLIAEFKNRSSDHPNPSSKSDPTYSKIINLRHWERLVSLLKGGKIVYGGQTDREHLFIAPTLLTEVQSDSPLMNEEIFGPLLPILPFSSLEEAQAIIQRHPDPLALYLFTQSKVTEQRIMSEIRFGGGCINDTMIHLSNIDLPFGGIGTSGIGAYHGRTSFETFSHFKSIVTHATWCDPSLRYPPYAKKMKFLKLFF